MNSRKISFRIAVLWTITACAVAFTSLRTFGQGVCGTCAPVPTSEATTYDFSDPTNYPYISFFKATVSDSAGDDFTGRYVNEASDLYPNTCYYDGAPFPRSQGVTNSPDISDAWQVGSSDGHGTAAGHNQWEHDGISPGSAMVAAVRAHTGESYPCGFDVTQLMFIYCPIYGDTFVYTQDHLTVAIYADKVINCRDGVCHTENY